MKNNDILKVPIVKLPKCEPRMIYSDAAKEAIVLIGRIGAIWSSGFDVGPATMEQVKELAKKTDHIFDYCLCPTTNHQSYHACLD